MRSLRISIVGHSNLPRELAQDEFDGHTVTVIQKRGGKLADLDNEHNPLYRVWDTPADVVILFLGGNDILDNLDDPNRKSVCSRLCEVVKRLRATLNCTVFVCNIEPRDYTNSRVAHFKANARSYVRLAACNNKNLTRHARVSQEFRVINLSYKELSYRVDDGVHFTEDSSRKVVKAFRRKVRRFLELGP